MNCYDFELKISAYIEGKLKQVVRREFSTHKETCSNCAEKLGDIAQLIRKLPELTPKTTSSQFFHNLHEKIREIDNQGPSIWQWLLQLRPLGFDPVPAVGFAMAMVMIIGASFLLLNQDGLPDVDFEKLSTQSQKQVPQHFKPSVITHEPTLPTMADSDSSVKPENTKHIDNRIKLVGGK